jgi:hypothetical protein
MRYRLEFFVSATEELPLFDLQSVEFEVDSPEKANAMMDFFKIHGIKTRNMFRIDAPGVEVLVNDGTL